MRYGNGYLRKLIAAALAAAMVLTMLPAQALAVESVGAASDAASDANDAKAVVSQGEQPEAILTQDGEIPVEEDWNAAFPYGTFVFGSYQADVGEKGALNAGGEVLPETALIPVYRLGGSTGAVTADESLWAQATGNSAAANQKLKAWLLATKEELDEAMLTPDENGQYPVSDPAAAGSVFFWAAQSKLNSLNGSGSLLCTKDGATAEISGQIDNLELTELDGKTYVLYSTSEVEYSDLSQEIPLTIRQDAINENTDRVVLRRLWLRSLDENGFGEARLLQTVLDSDSCKESSLASAKLKDGIYAGASLVKAQADPYYANLAFVRAQIDGTGLQTLALFEMGGNSYLIREAELKVLAEDEEASATLIPVFPETTGTEVSIGVDDSGNLIAVYTAPVANSQSNATGVLNDLFVVGSRPELSFGRFEASLRSVEGDKAYFDIEATVLNNGNANADCVFIQFSCGTGGTDSTGSPAYEPIDIRGSELSTGGQQDIDNRNQVSEDYINGVYSSDHLEYNGSNNRFEKTFKHETIFTIPARITTALGMTLRLPVTYETTSEHPDIEVTEVTDGTEGWTPRMGLCYYDEEHKAIVAAPNSTAQAMLAAGQVPTGILEINDKATNSISAVTYPSRGPGSDLYGDRLGGL